LLTRAAYLSYGHTRYAEIIQRCLYFIKALRADDCFNLDHFSSLDKSKMAPTLKRGTHSYTHQTNREATLSDTTLHFYHRHIRSPFEQPTRDIA
jgi:hypothetical protein